ncbi:heavy-metal-associated domain-containing protein [Methyloversatilis thermotolerans]|uniref:heavy-metal-associated domain-containing protein n=1 Tax=Methyloversatilis thermotolerans TaxID=1346290 RepID=UPI000371A91D|nr:heavy metal-associated domain-containing protein [Methyloversatilis thermotolerans]
MSTTRIRIVGMNCPKCVAGLQAMLEALPGVRRVEMHVDHGDATVEHDPQVSRETLLERVEAAGYDAL